MLKGFWLCVKRFPKPELVIFACVAVLVYAFGKAIDNYVRDKAVEIYEHTNTVSKEDLEIVLCPMPRVYGLRLTHFGESLPKFFNKLLFEDLVTPFMRKHEAKLKRQGLFRFRGRLKNGPLKCLENERQYKPTHPLRFLRHKMYKAGGICRTPRRVYMPLLRALQDGTMIKKFIDKHLGLLDERLLEEYPGLLDQAWVLPYDNLTIEQMLDYIGVNLKRYIDENVLRKSVENIDGPLQTLEESVVDTRMAPNCFRHLFRHNQNRGHQRAKIVYQFRKSCPKETGETLISRAPCLETADMYITMYITAYNQFTDVPAASVIVPYRVAADENTLVHVSAVKRIHKKQCKDYGQEETQVTCIEDCLYEKMTSENQTENGNVATEGKMRCRLPWIDRLKQRSNRAVVLPLCHTRQELKSTIQTVRDMFDITEASDCSRRCPRHCHQLTVTPRLAGSAYTPLKRSGRIPRHPRLEVLISDEMPVLSEAQQYDFGKMVAEMLGNLSFLVGVSLVALYDWLIGLVLWMFGKLPFIPAIPPLIKNEIYMSEACSCAETEEERRQSVRDTMDEGETFLAASFKHHRRTSVLRSFNPHEDTHKRRRRAMTLNQIPVIAIRSSAIDTMARTFPSEMSAERVCPVHPSVDQRRSGAEDGSFQALSGEGSRTQRPSEGDRISGSSRSFIEQLPEDTPILVTSQTAESGQGSAVIVTEARLSRSTLKKTSIHRVAPSETITVIRQASEETQVTATAPSEIVPERTDQALPSIGAPAPGHPPPAVTFDLGSVERILDGSDGQRETDDSGRAGPQYRSRPRRPRAVRTSPDPDRPPAD